MVVSYNKLKSLMNRKGESFNSLKEKGVISDHAMRQLSSCEPTSLRHIDSLCQYFKVPIEDIVEIKLD